jgi:hypothetical protein
VCLRAYRSSYYPNKYAYKVVAQAWGFHPVHYSVYSPPVFPYRMKYQLNETVRSKGHMKLHIRKINRLDKRPSHKIPRTKHTRLVQVPSGIHLYTKLADAIGFAKARTRCYPEDFVVIKCSIDDVIAYGDDLYGRAVIAQTVTPKEIVWTKAEKSQQK